jgi:RNA polymerase sigma-70 factor (ECF subfamily)
VRIPLVADVADVPGPRRGRVPGRPAARAHDPADDVLVARIVNGDQVALGALYDRYRPPRLLPGPPHLRRRRHRRGRRAGGLPRVLARPAPLRPQRGAFGTWLLTLVHHKSVDAVRRESAIRRRTVPAAEDGDEWSAPPGPGADQAALGAVVAGQVRAALGRLPEEQRHALALAYYGGYTQREVAALTGVPLGTVKSRMFTGVQRLRSALGPILGDVVSELGRAR